MIFLKYLANLLKHHYFIVIVSITTFFLYYPSLHYDFIHSLDDDWLIVNNESIKDLSWNGIKYLFFSDNTDLHYHPLTYLSLAIDYHFFGLNPFYIKLHSLILHILNGVLLYYLLLLLFKSKFVAIFSASFFLLASLNIESVVWANCRRQTLSSFYFLISLILYVKSISQIKINNSLFFTSFFFFMLSCLAKSSSVTMPFYIFFIYIFHNKKIDNRLFIHFIIFFIASLLIVYLNLRIDQGNFLKRTFDYNVFEHIVFIFYSFGFYFFKFIFSYPQGVFYPAPSENLTIFPHSFYLIALFGIVLITLIRYHYLKKQWDLLLIITLYFLSTVVMANRIIFPFQDLPVIVTDRYFYHNGFWVVTYIVLVLYYIFNNRTKFFAGICTLILLFQIFFHRLYLPAWENSITLMEYLLKNYPSEEFYYRLGIDYYKENLPDKAVENFMKADRLELDIYINNSWHFYYDKCLVYFYDENIPYLKKNIEVLIKKGAPEEFIYTLIELFKENGVDVNIKYEFKSNMNEELITYTRKLISESLIIKDSNL